MSTVTESAAPADELTHAAALTKADVDALEAFLSARFDAMRSGTTSPAARTTRRPLWRVSCGT
jgi:hypothetical protein